MEFRVGQKVKIIMVEPGRSNTICEIVDKSIPYDDLWNCDKYFKDNIGRRFYFDQLRSMDRLNKLERLLK